jgi:hypothetical protein
MKTAKGIAIIILILCVSEIIVGVGRECISILQTVNKHLPTIATGIENTVADIDATIIIARGAVVNANMTLGRIEAMSQSWQTVADKQLDYWKDIQVQTGALLADLDGAVADSRTLITGINRSVNEILVGDLDSTLKSSDASLKSLSALLATLNDKTGQSMDHLNALITDPAITNTLHNIDTTTSHIAKTGEHVEATVSHMPNTMANVEKMSRTSSKWQKWILAARIVGIFLQAF